MSTIEQSVKAGIELGKLALHYGCWDEPGHYWHDTQGRHLWDNLPPDFLKEWVNLTSGGLLRNGEVPYAITGKVYWTCGGAAAFWYAFYWWDNSIDHRPESHSSFYVRGFGWPEAPDAFDYACSVFPTVVARQRRPLVLQNVTRQQPMSKETPSTSG